MRERRSSEEEKRSTGYAFGRTAQSARVFHRHFHRTTRNILLGSLLKQSERYGYQGLFLEKEEKDGKNWPKSVGGVFIEAAAAAAAAASSIINKVEMKIGEEERKKRKKERNWGHKLEMDYDLMSRVLICNVHIRVRAYLGGIPYISYPYVVASIQIKTIETCLPKEYALIQH